MEMRSSGLTALNTNKQTNEQKNQKQQQQNSFNLQFSMVYILSSTIRWNEETASF